MTFETIVFDLGGVLGEFGGVEPMKLLSGIRDEEELWGRWLNCQWVRRFERGHCSPEEFASGVVEDWHFDLTPGQFLEQFGGWVRDPIPGANEIVEAARAKLPVACLSNTNSLHWHGAVSDWPFVGLLDETFLSFELGMVKPDREIFDYVSGQLGVSGPKLLFLDDNSLNVAAAVEAGWSAVRVQGVGEATQALLDHGVLDD